MILLLLLSSQLKQWESLVNKLKKKQLEEKQSLQKTCEMD